MQQGQIFKIHSDFYYVQSGVNTFECKLRHVLKKQKQKVFVGDFVEFKDGAIEKILPRQNYITRPTVANVDQVLIISAVKEPELSFLQLNRYIALSDILADIFREQKKYNDEKLSKLGKLYTYPEMVFTTESGNFVDRSGLNTQIV